MISFIELDWDRVRKLFKIIIIFGCIFEFDRKLLRKFLIYFVNDIVLFDNDLADFHNRNILNEMRVISIDLLEGIEELLHLAIFPITGNNEICYLCLRSFIKVGEF